ncbi:hypothetical protein [Sinorhizobium meliloti]|uniref:hypothetical protein n=1 Tax=Rhizobium meliloti TaxID=382 RepID=UPI00399B85F8
MPEVDYFPPKVVPATTPQYANGGRTVEIPSPAPAKEEKPLAAAAEAAPLKAATAAEECSVLKVLQIH